jgi:tetratricopeptide (TPR) repeat protein
MKRYIVIFLACCSLVITNYSMIKSRQTFQSDLYSCCIEWGLAYVHENRLDKALESFSCVVQKSSNPRLKAEALLNIGSIYYFGNGLIKPDYAKALTYFQDPAIQQPLKRSQKVASPQIRALAWFFIGNIYLHGDQTVEKDIFMAEGYLKAAAEQTDEPSAQIEAKKTLKELQGYCVIL